MLKQKRLMFSLILFLLFCFSCSSDHGPAIGSVSRGEIQSIIEFLSSDHLEGRAPATRGGELAEEYIKSVYKLLGVAPYEGDYFQEFKLKGYTLEELTVEARGIELQLREDVVGSFPRDQHAFSLSGDAVFAGYGIVSEAWSWDDYKDVSVEDKIVIVRVNEPGRDDQELFEGQALTYFGRWTCKIEEAARRGARGILLVHTRETAGYSWHVVQNSWDGEELYLPGSLGNNLSFRGWIREDQLREILARAGIDIDELYRHSETRDFMPVDLGFRIMVKGRNAFRELTTRNVIGAIPGSDPKLKERAILLSAHIDHLGRDESREGDQIYNGAIDNGSAVAAMIMTVKLLAEHRQELKYSVIALACQVEEAGLLGSEHFAESIDPASIICNINFESTPVWGRTRDIMAVGARYSTLEDIMKEILSERNLDYSSFSLSDQGFFYRSDQFSFARKGIPAIWISAGEDYVDGTNHIRDFFVGGAYHTVDDEYDSTWPLESTMQTIEAAVLLVDYINSRTPDIRWKGKMTFPLDE